MCNTSPHATNNLILTNIGPAVADHDRHAMNEPATKQDLYTMGVQIDSNFGKVINQFTIVDSQFVNLRTDMNAGFDKAQVALNKTFFKFGSLCFTMMFAVLSIDRWWR